MGSSGAGKTTLLNAVAGEAAGGVLSGAVRFNGAKVDTATIRRLRAFVFQDDVVMGTMTAYEAISMSAKLRLPPSMSLEEKVKRVEQVIEILQLDQCKDNVIGYPGEKSGVSGGERKRISIAMELITNPSVLFLDEPTSGLDTHTAHSVCKTLKELAAAGRTVVATIHQPSSDIFHMFDNLLLLANGQILYQGPSRLCMDYFAQRGSPCPQFTNPADHIFMKVLNDQLASSELERQAKREKISALLAEYAESSTFKEMEARVQVPGSGVDKSTANFSASLLLQMSVLFNRAKNNAIRNRLILRAKVGQSIFMGLLVGLIYRDLKHNQKSIQKGSKSNCSVASAYRFAMQAFPSTSIGSNTSPPCATGLPDSSSLPTLSSLSLLFSLSPLLSLASSLSLLFSLLVPCPPAPLIPCTASKPSCSTSTPVAVVLSSCKPLTSSRTEAQVRRQRARRKIRLSPRAGSMSGSSLPS
eukprot:765901-Hanusia_phi.AAC.1